MDCFKHTDEQYIALFRKSLSEGSVRAYSSQIKRIKRIVEQARKHKDGVSMCQIIGNPKVYIPILERETKESERLQLVKTILAVMKHAGVKEYDCQHSTSYYQQWYDVFEPLNKQFTEQRESNEPTERQKLALLDWKKDVIPLYDQLSKTSYGSTEHILLAMYTLMPPRRQVDYHKVQVLDSNETVEGVLDLDSSLSGVLDLSKKHITIVQGKTISTYDVWTKELPNDLIRAIKASLRKQPRKYLLVRVSDGQPFVTPSAFTKYHNDVLKRLFKNPYVSLNSLRHAFASHIHQQPMTSLYQLKQISRDMGHSVETNMSYVLH